MNEKKLRAKMVELGETVPSVSQKLGISEASLRNKLTGRTEFTQGEISLLVSSFGLSKDEVMDIFFSPEVS